MSLSSELFAALAAHDARLAITNHGDAMTYAESQIAYKTIQAAAWDFAMTDEFDAIYDTGALDRFYTMGERSFGDLHDVIVRDLAGLNLAGRAAFFLGVNDAYNRHHGC